MSNQEIQLGTLIIPWLTMFFMPKGDIKRFLPTGFIAQLMGILLIEIGVANGWWAMKETLYPLALLPLYPYGLFPVVSTWILKFTYGHFGRYLTAELAVNAFGSFIFWPWLATRGIIEYNVTVITLITTTICAVIVYVFQMWREAPVNSFLAQLHPVSAKPHSEEQRSNKED